MEARKTVPMTVRVTQETLDMVRKHALGKHCHGVFVEQCIRAFVQQLREGK